MYSVPRQAPSWIVVLDVAKRWFTQPFKVGGKSKLLWFVREEALRDVEIKRQRKDYNEAKSRKR